MNTKTVKLMKNERMTNADDFTTTYTDVTIYINKLDLLKLLSNSMGEGIGKNILSQMDLKMDTVDRVRLSVISSTNDLKVTIRGL